MKMQMPAGMAGLFTAATVHAADAQTAPATSATSTLLQVVLGLAVVMIMIAGAAWLARRYLPAAGGARGPVRIVGGVMVGPRERVVVVEIADTWVVAGVTSQNVSALHAMPRPLGEPADASMNLPADRNFSHWLAKAMKGGPR